LIEIFTYKNSNYGIISTDVAVVQQEIRNTREIIERYTESHAVFETTLVPILPLPHASYPIKRMTLASALTGIGPMASVAGIIAEIAATNSHNVLQTPVTINNGGDLFIISDTTVYTAIFAGKKSPFNQLAFEIKSEFTPLSVCSSSGSMGHSRSFGRCDLSTVFSKDGALADSAATLCANLIESETDLQHIADYVVNIPGITGVCAIKNNRIALAGKLPDIIKLDTHIKSDKIIGNILKY
jgi:ApbE superfamily uncharacterized protein (UPF0280 family)